MSNNSGIEWTESTWNPLAGCTRVSAGCQNCYAEKMARRLGRMAEVDIAKGRRTGGKAKYLNVLDPHGRWNGTINLDEKVLVEPLRWRKPRRVFVNSMSDLFHPGVPFEFIDKVFAVMALCPQHTFQVLTKRPERMAEHLNTEARAMSVSEHIERFASTKIATFRADRSGLKFGKDGIKHATSGGATPTPWPLPNVWLGTSVEDQATADERIPHLLRCPAAVRFLSCEPLLGPVDLSFGENLPADEDSAVGWVRCDVGGIPHEHRLHERCDRQIHWVIVGGESGPGARPCNVGWMRSIVQQCKAARVPCFVKQLGAWIRHGTHDPCPRCTQSNCLHRVKMDDGSVMFHRGGKGGESSEWPVDLRVREFPASACEVTP